MLPNIYETFNFAEFWDTLTTSFVAYEFIAFVFVLILLYYLFPRKAQWTVLLGGSLLFYSIAGIQPLITVLLTTFVVYASALLIEATDKKNKKKRRLFTAIGVLILLAILCFVKIYSFLGWKFSLVIPMGISYYTFSSIGYLADVYWGKDRAQRNYFKLSLFVLYFPKILQGPISRHKTLAPQLVEGHRFDYNNFCSGLQLAIWGYFKKLVIADRAAIFTASVWGNIDSFGGAVLALTAVLSVFQLYCDFSGCMDIARGISEMLGIKLEKNFDRPFVSKNAAEFWRRWHMSLGSWFKDYVLMPLVISPKMIKFSSAIGKKCGRRAGKAVMTVVPTLVVWCLTGLWHGTGADYLVWGVYWATLMIVSSVFAPEIAKLAKLCHIDTKSAGWQRVQIARTFLLFCVSRIITGSGGIGNAAKVFGRIFTQPMLWQLFNGTLYKQGLIWQEFVFVLLMIVLLCLVMAYQGKHSVRETVAQWKMVPRCAFWVLVVMWILVFGIYGPGFDASAFIYANF